MNQKEEYVIKKLKYVQLLLNQTSPLGELSKCPNHGRYKRAEREKKSDCYA